MKSQTEEVDAHIIFKIMLPPPPSMNTPMDCDYVPEPSDDERYSRTTVNGHHRHSPAEAQSDMEHPRFVTVADVGTDSLDAKQDPSSGQFFTDDSSFHHDYEAQSPSDDEKEGRSPDSEGATPSCLPVAAECDIAHTAQPSESVASLQTPWTALPTSSNVRRSLQQFRLEHRTAALFMRIRRLKGSYSVNHSNEQLSRFVSLHASKPESVLALQSDSMLENRLQTLFERGSVGDIPVDGLFRNAHLSRLSTDTLAKLIRKFDSKKFADLIPKWIDQKALLIGQSEAQDVSRMSTAVTDHTRDLSRQFDPDATDSSSEGESCDEMELQSDLESDSSDDEFREQYHSSIAVDKRASWMWWWHRAQYGARWAWLQSQVADLELRIRRQSNMQQHLLESRTQIKLAPASGDAESSCSRARPLATTVRRRAVRTPGMFRWNRLASRLCTVQCCCVPPVEPCVMCSGRQNNVVRAHDLCTKDFAERYSLIDQEFHPVLSHPRRADAAVSRKLQNYLRAQPLRPALVKRKTPGGHMTSDAVPLKVASLEEQTHPSVSMEEKMADLKARLSSSLPGIAREQAHDMASHSGSGSSTPNILALSDGAAMSPRATSVSIHRRSTLASTSTTYDIDNIIIDPSVAAVSRVERLQYKEIVTPGWRTVEFGESPADESAGGVHGETESEDLSDAAVGRRHGAHEESEKQRHDAYKEWVTQSVSVSHNKRVLSSQTSLDSLGAASPSLSDSVFVLHHNAPYPVRTFPLSDEQAKDIAAATIPQS